MTVGLAKGDFPLERGASKLQVRPGEGTLLFFSQVRPVDLPLLSAAFFFLQMPQRPPWDRAKIHATCYESLKLQQLVALLN